MISVIPISAGGIRTFQGNDIIFYNPDCCLYAAGCKFNCKHCHSKECSSPNEKENITEETVLRVSSQLGKHKTLIGLGGDFAFQLIDWISFCTNIKRLDPSLMIVFYTGFKCPEELIEYYPWLHHADLASIDAIIWGRHETHSNVISKEVTLSKSLHMKLSRKIRIPLEKADGD
jgi:pyruvate-formate lyase-activating enzyme